MVDPESGAAPHATRRDRRADRTRRRWRRVATVVACVALLAGFALAATETVRFGGAHRPSLARTVEAAPGSTTSTASTATTVARRACRSPLDDADPLRLWIGGDSLAGSLGPALGAMTGATGVVQPQFDSRVSSGLTSPGFFDWPDHAAKEMARLDPEIVVFIIGANDFGAPTVGRSDDEGGQPAWKAEYTDRIEAMLAAFGDGTRTVVWVGSPSFKDTDRNASIKAIDEVAQEVVSRHRNAVYIDSYALFTDAEGKYQASLPPLEHPDDEPVLVRAGDGVHLTSEGANRLAHAVFQHIDAQCKVTAQAVPGVVKGTIQTEGSTQVVGGTNRTGGTVQTSPPASSPPATTPPPSTTNPPVTTAPPATTAPPTTTAPPATSTPPST